MSDGEDTRPPSARAGHRRARGDTAALARDGDEPRPQGRRPDLHRRRGLVPGARDRRLPAHAPPAGGAGERPDRAGDLQSPPLGRQRDPDRALRPAVRLRALHLRRSAADRRAVAGLPASRLAVALALPARRRPALRELRLHASGGGLQLVAAALGHRLHLQQRSRRLDHRRRPHRGRPGPPVDQPRRDGREAASARPRLAPAPDLQLLGGGLQLDDDHRRHGDGGGAGHAGDRPPLRRRLLRSGRGRRAALLPAPELDLLHRDLPRLPAGPDRRDLGDPARLLGQATALPPGRWRSRWRRSCRSACSPGCRT